MSEYSATWPEQFEIEAASLRAVLRPWLAPEGIQHIGSTAIPGLAAKPILDMMAGVLDLIKARSAVPDLAEQGYRQGEHRPQEALWFFKQDNGEKRSHHLHLTPVSSELWRERLAFRDALVANPNLRREYQSLKQFLAGRATEIGEYTVGKRDFVQSVLKRSGISLD